MNTPTDAPAGTPPAGPWFALLESNTTGTGREFCAAARARGLRPVLLTRDGGRYAYVAQDAVATRTLDTADEAAVLTACRELASDGGLVGLTSSSEYYAAPAAAVAGLLGLPAPDAAAVAHCRAKDSQRAAHRDAGVPVPGFRVAASAGEAVAAATALGHPVVLKPVSGSGSVGVRLCRDADETRRWAHALLDGGGGAPGTDRMLVEEALEGREFSVETFDGEVVAVVAKHLSAPPYYVETGHDVPAALDPDAARALGDTALAALAALGLGWGAAHTELRLTARGPVIIEVNPRLAGGMIPVAVRAALGVDLVDAVVARAAGLPRAAPTPGTGHAAVRFLRLAAEGQVSGVDGLAAALSAPGVVAATASVVTGATVRRTHSFKDRLGCVVATGPDQEAAALRATAAARLISVEFAPDHGGARPATRQKARQKVGER